LILWISSVFSWGNLGQYDIAPPFLTANLMVVTPVILSVDLHMLSYVVEIQTLLDLRSSYVPEDLRRKSNFAQVGTEYTYDQLHMYIQWSPV